MDIAFLYGIGHIPFHFLIPLAIYFTTKNKLQLIQLESANLIDLDHLFAAQIFVAERCSLSTHPLHGVTAASFYFVLALLPVSRWFGIGALFHLLLDSPTCLM